MIDSRAVEKALDGVDRNREGLIALLHPMTQGSSETAFTMDAK